MFCVTCTFTKRALPHRASMSQSSSCSSSPQIHPCEPTGFVPQDDLGTDPWLLEDDHDDPMQGDSEDEGEDARAFMSEDVLWLGDITISERPANASDKSHALWLNDFATVDDKPATGKDLFDLYFMSCIRNALCPNTNITDTFEGKSDCMENAIGQRGTLVRAVAHLLRVRHSQITQTQFDDLIIVLQDYREGSPAHGMVEFIINDHRSYPLLLARVLMLLRTLSHNAAAAFVHAFINSCHPDDYSVSLMALQRVSNVVFKTNSIIEVIQWIKRYRAHDNDEYQTVSLSKSIDHIVYDMTTHSLRCSNNIHSITTNEQGFFSNLCSEAHCNLKSTNTSSHTDQWKLLGQHLQELNAHGFPRSLLVAVDFALSHKTWISTRKNSNLIRDASTHMLNNMILQLIHWVHSVNGKSMSIDAKLCARNCIDQTVLLRIANTRSNVFKNLCKQLFDNLSREVVDSLQATSWSSFAQIVKIGTCA